MQESRLFKIVYYLLQNKRATATELAREYEVSVRTIYRDIDRLSEAGIPVYAEMGRNGGIYLLEDYTIDKVLLSKEQKEEVLATLQSVTVIGAKQEDQLLNKLSALFQVNADSWFEADFSRWGEKSSDLEKFEVMKKAVIERRVLHICYESAYGRSSQRAIYPLKLLYKAKEWYVKAYCTQKEAYRLFKLNRIVEWELLQDVFEPMEFPADEEKEQHHQRVVLRFANEVAYRVYDEFERSQIKRLDEEQLEVVAYMTVDEWMIGYLLSFGVQVEVIEPISLQKEIAKRALQIYEKNKHVLSSNNVSK